MSKKILVTGGAGFIGSALVDSLVEKKYEVVVIDDLSSGFKDNINPKARFFQWEIADDRLDGLFKKEQFDCVFHLAAQKSIRKSVVEPHFDCKINILDSLKLLEYSSKYNVKKFIYSSTGGAIYGDCDDLPIDETCPPNPISPYAISKYTFELYLKFYYANFGLDYVSLRYSNVYGARQLTTSEGGVVSIFIKKLLHNEIPIVFGEGDHTRDFVYVDDVVNANILAFESKGIGIFNVATCNEISIQEIIDELSKLVGRKIEVEYQKAIIGDVFKSCLSSELIWKKFGWKPKVLFKDGLEKTYKWFKENENFDN